MAQVRPPISPYCRQPMKPRTISKTAPRFLSFTVRLAITPPRSRHTPPPTMRHPRTIRRASQPPIGGGTAGAGSHNEEAPAGGCSRRADEAARLATDAITAGDDDVADGTSIIRAARAQELQFLETG